MNGKSYCSKMSNMTHANGKHYDAICSTTISNSSWYSSSCPKGWGRSKWYHPDDDYSVQNAQGYINDNSTPIYSTVTKYRDAVYNYITTRVAKA